MNNPSFAVNCNMEKAIEALDKLTGLEAEESQIAEFLKAVITEENAEVIRTHIQADGEKAISAVYKAMRNFAKEKSKDSSCVMVTGKEAGEIISKLWCIPVDGTERVTPAEPAKKSIFKRRSLE